MVLTFVAQPRVVIMVRRSHSSDSGEDRIVRFCQSLRIVEERDVDGTVVRVVRTVLTRARDKAVGGTELAEASGLKRVTVLHHLRRLEELGLVAREDHKYRLRISCMEALMEQMRRDTLAMFAEAEEMARQIDSEYQLTERAQSARKLEGGKHPQSARSQAERSLKKKRC